MVAYTTQALEGRNVYRARHGKAEIRVVAGYEIRSDTFVSHCYVTPDGGAERKLHALSGNGYSTLDEAIEAPFNGAEHAIDSGSY